MDGMREDVIDAPVGIVAAKRESFSLPGHFPCIDKMPCHTQMSATARDIIEIAGDDDGQSRISSHECEDFLEVGETFGVVGSEIQVGVEEQEWLPMDMNDGMEQAALFTATNHPVVGIAKGLHRMPGEDGVAVFTALEMEVVAEDGGHSREQGQLGGHVSAFSSLHAAIDLLQCDKIRVLPKDDLGNALEIHLPVHAASMLDVVAQDTQRDCGGDRCSA
jgi:hypothetical protein